jgi:hypothetical protein
MTLQAALSLDHALSAPVAHAAGSQQLGLIGDVGAKPLAEGQAGANLSAGPQLGGPGRPKGSQNKFRRDLVRIVTAKLGRHPLEEVVRLYKAPREDLVATFGHGIKEAELRERLLFKLVECTTPKMPVEVSVDKTETVTVVLGDLGAGQMVNQDDDAVLDLPFNEINEIAGEEA